VTPNASCLLVGPSDWPLRLPDDVFAPRPRTAAIIEVQRRVSGDLGCAFFDAVAFMGGPLSMVRWVRSEPALGAPDHVHYTRAGYERMADVLYDALLEGVRPASPPLARAVSK
jgi:lysophospholipase L1-like esterase